MNAKERQLIDRLDAVIRVISSLTPQNPADGRAISENLRTATTASGHLVWAITAVRQGDYGRAEQHLDQADAITNTMRVPTPARFT